MMGHGAASVSPFLDEGIKDTESTPEEDGDPRNFLELVTSY
jgi:hypothetical protein